ncbi:MAG TPA: type II secretion system protein [Methylophilus sp.]
MPNGKPVIPRSRGFSYIGVLIAMALCGLALSGTAMVWHHQSQRMQQQILLETGEAYRLAIGRYYEATPGQLKQYPTQLAELIEDKRFPVPRRHLRRLLPDPFHARQPMALMLQNGTIVGVYSSSKRSPIKSRDYLEIEAGFESAKHYSDWQFSYQPNTLADIELQISQRSFD